jgi:S-adenosylmethionine:tRNA ribosyltransferase-isomerase
VLVSAFDFHLPPDQIAQAPPAERGTSRLLVLERATGRVTHARIGDLPEWLRAGDLLVVNDTRVFPARLLGRREPSGGRVEVFLLERLGPDRFDALVHPGQKLKPGARVVLEGETPGGPVIHGEIEGRASFGRRTIRFQLGTPPEPGGSAIDAAIDAIGHMPLPPYIARPDAGADRERYQTVYARERGSVAAPTAGLHFTPGILAAIEARGVERAAVTLHVGYGTFKPIRVDEVEAHVVDPERYTIAPDVAARVNAARADGRRVVAVGTTTVRALESAGRGGPIAAGPGTADVFLHPGGPPIAHVDALLTNFHLPRSSLLMLVCAFAGRDTVLRAYHEAVAAGYRFYSYGDAMLIT